MSSTELAEPSLDLSHDFVDLKCLQKGRFLFQLCTPCRQDRVHSPLRVIAVINNLLDSHFPFLKTHRLFLLDFGIVHFDRRDETKRPYGTRFVIANSVATVATFLVRDKRSLSLTVSSSSVNRSLLEAPAKTVW